MSTSSASVQADPSQDPSSHYYLHPSDNPGVKLVSIKFDGTGYNDWKRSFLISLSAKNKCGFVDGTIVKPDATDPCFKAWERCNSMMISWILGVLDQNLARSVLYFKSAREIWVNLEERYGQASGTLLFSLQQSMYEMKQGNDTISGYYRKMKMLWDQLDDVDPLQICSCANCTCGITTKLMKSQEDMKLIEFLMKLNNGFEMIRGNILVMNPLPYISHAHRMLMQEENHKKVNQMAISTATEDGMACFVNSRNFSDRFKTQGYDKKLWFI